MSPGWNGKKEGRRSLRRSVTSMEEGVPWCGGARGTCCEVGGKSHVKEVSTGRDGSHDVEEQVPCIHWWPCSEIGVPT